MTVLISATAATAVLNYDLMKASEAGPYVNSNEQRKLVSAGLVGSAAVSDCEVRILVGQKEVARLRNTTAGAAKVPLKDDTKYINEIVPANTPIAAVVSIAAATNALVIELDIRPVVVRQVGRPWGQGGFRGRGARQPYSLQMIGGRKMVVYSDGTSKPARY